MAKRRDLRILDVEDADHREIEKFQREMAEDENRDVTKSEAARKMIKERCDQRRQERTEKKLQPIEA